MEAPCQDMKRDGLMLVRSIYRLAKCRPLIAGIPSATAAGSEQGLVKSGGGTVEKVYSKTASTEHALCSIKTPSRIQLEVLRLKPAITAQGT